MSSIFSKDQPALFLGIAEYFESSGGPFPFGSVDLFQLSQHKIHIIYPGLIQSNVWVVLVSTEFLEGLDFSKWELGIADENNNELGKVTFASLSHTDKAESQPKPDMKEGVVAVFKNSPFTLIHFTMNRIVNHPGQYTVFSNYDGKVVPIGSIEFHYRKTPTLTPDQIKAIESASISGIGMDLGCKFCSTKLRVYTGLSRLPKLEKKGYLWYTELEDEFACECGKTIYSLEYVKESMHGLLLQDFSRQRTGLSYVRR